MSELEYFKNIPVERLREQVIEQLKANYAQNNIMMEEFERRLEVATATEDRFELMKVVHDLPVLPVDSSDRNPYENGSGTNADINLGAVKNEETMVSIFSGVTRKGSWRPARYSKMLAFFGGADLDYSRAHLPPGEFFLEIMCVFGGVDIVVPDGVNVEVSGIPIFGGLDNKTSGEVIPGAPTLKIRAMVFFGGVDIKPMRRRHRRW